MEEEHRQEIESRLEEIRRLCEAGATERAWRQLERAKEVDPDEVELVELEALLLQEEDRHEEALALLDAALAEHPKRWSAVASRSSALMEVGRFQEALATLEALQEFAESAQDPDRMAWIHFEKACCLDRLGRERDANREFRAAASLDPDDYPEPVRLTAEDFDAIVRNALDSIPERFDPYLRQVVVVVRDHPDSSDPFVLGLYDGVPRTERDHDLRDHLDRIFIFKRNLEIECFDENELREEVRKTVIHEIAHHFGLEDEDMGEYA